MNESTERQLPQDPQNALVQALEDATALLEIEFGGTEGSGHHTLLKCKTALTRAGVAGVQTD